jgi:hypothetical protein
VGLKVGQFVSILSRTASDSSGRGPWQIAGNGLACPGPRAEEFQRLVVDIEQHDTGGDSSTRMRQRQVEAAPGDDARGQ